ncbi:MAG TPA: GH92 family glycosyl hydrolase, partial [Ktedonobacteraceae bacterium]|nr:GH92 family glycosyl hydrolase [Ktedonobacteraceae bacterium]
FSLTHFSGRGCRVYQDIPFMPYIGTPNVSPATNNAAYTSPFSHKNESAQPGYYSVHLDKPDVTVELSVTPHTGMGQFTYPASTQSTMLINTGASINGTTDASVTITPAINQVTGFATSKIGCGSNPYTLYFAARFDRPFQTFGTWNAANINANATSSTGAHTGAFVSFDTTTNQVIHVQVGISFVSIANAQANLTAEDTHFDFDSIRNSADSAWNGHLSAIMVRGGTLEEKQTFYTALYHTFFHPNIFNDVNGQYLGFDGKVHTVPAGHFQYENIAGWDQYRSLIRLRALLDPSEASDIAQSLINDAQQGDGHLPRWEQASADSHGMNGDDGSLIIAEAYAFGARNFDTSAALSAMVNGQAKIREGLDDYLKLGYVAASTTPNSAAITQEYSNADFAIATFAQALGNTQVAATFKHRAGNWQNLFNTASGYIQPRNHNGSWTNPFSPTSQNGFQEGDSAQYTWLEPFDLNTLFHKMGGNATVVSRLDSFFGELNAGADSFDAFMGNEPCFEVPWEYDFAGAPSHTQVVVRRIQTQLFNASPGGLPGNDDGGAMSSWYVFSAIGLYPEITGVGGFVIGSPLFTEVSIRLPGDHTLQINAPAASDTQPYVQSLQLNGKPTTSLWLPWSTLQNGATLDFALGDTATNWGSSAQDAPPGV